MALRILTPIILAVAVALGALGCSQTRVARVVRPVPFSQYRAGEFDWASVRRVVIVPLWNESPESMAAHEVRQVLCAELQSLGQFEVLIAPIETPPEWSREVRVSGRFDEMDLVRLGRAFHADAVLCGAVTHYHSYSPPRLGLSLRLISTAESIVIASVDGLWDSRDQIVAEEARWYYGNTVTPSQANSSADVILASPRLFQKYVSAQVSRVMCGPVYGIVPAGATLPVGPAPTLP